MQEGAAFSIRRTVEINGWKQIEFDLPVNVNGTRNWRADLIRNEYELRVRDGSETDWYRITEPEDESDGIGAEIHVTCPHCSILLKKRNIYLEFTDENGIGTLTELAGRALAGSGWSLGTVDTFYEADGQTEKVRTYICGEKTGSYQMIQDLCDKFCAYPVFHGDTQTVDLLARKRHDGMMEMRLDKNLTNMARKQDSSDIITRLYVEGEYGDLGYVGIDDVNPTGLNYLMDFSYFREIGALTAEQEATITSYTQTAGTLRQQIRTLAAENEAKITSLMLKWGSQGYALYTVSGSRFVNPIYGSGADAETGALAVGDTIAGVRANGQYTYRTLSSIAPVSGEKWGIKFLLKVGGQLGAKEVSIEAKQKTVETLTEEKARASSQTEKNGLQDQINATNQSIAELQSEATTLMLECVNLALTIGANETQLNTWQNQLSAAEAAFAETMGDLLLDGYYSDDSFAPGQEESLFNDAKDLMGVLCRPDVSYTLSEIDLVNTEGYSDEVYQINMAVHFYNEELNVNDYGFVSKIQETLDEPNTRGVTVETNELNIQSKSFASFLRRVTDAAQLLKEKNTIYGRAAAIGADGTLATAKLNGIMDVLKNRLMSTVSGWYTDDNGNMIFEALDGSSAMMLCGSGFMVAAGKDESGEWNWRTFGTGEGFTADLITAGVLRAGVITILGSDQFYWNGENLYVIDPTDNRKQIRIGRYDGTNLGIGYTLDGGTTWRNAIGFDGVHLSASDSERLDVMEGEIRLAAERRPGSTQLLRNSRKLVKGTDITSEWTWSHEYSESEPYGTTLLRESPVANFNCLRFTGTDLTTDQWASLWSPVFELPKDWDGRKITLSAYVYGGNWRTIDGFQFLICLSTGARTRPKYGSKNVFYVNSSNVVVWGDDVKCEQSIKSGAWRRIAITFTLDENDITGSTDDSIALDACTHAFAAFYFRRNGHVRIYAPKLEWGDMDTDWCEAPEDTDAKISEVSTSFNVRADGIEANVTEITNWKGTAETQITENSEKIELEAKKTYGSTQLIPRTKVLPL